MERNDQWARIACAGLILALVACGGAEDDELQAAVGPSAPDGHGGGESRLSLEALLERPFERLDAAERDRLAAIAGEMDPRAYVARYPETELFPELERAADGGEAPGRAQSALTGLVPGVWNTVAVPGGRCSDGSPYKMFVMPALSPAIRTSGELIVYFEPGGACWDYASCTGQAGVRGAANPNGIPDNYMSLTAFLDPATPGGSASAILTPLLWNASALGIEPNRVVTDQWTKVFLPYCTGDVFAGNRTAVYRDPTGAGPNVTFHHFGAINVERALDVLRGMLRRPSDLLVTGCSAGGAGALVNYHFVRSALTPSRSALLDDSGPIFPAPGRGNQFPLHQEIRGIWNVDYVLGRLQAAVPTLDLAADLGRVNEANARLYPQDRLALTLFRQDYNYSIYSYARFYGLDEDDPADERRIRALWNQDVDQMIAQYRRLPNLRSFVPFYRSLNDSHCTTVVNWTGTQIRSTGYDVGDFIDDLLDRSRQPRSEDEGFNFWDYFVVDFPSFLVGLFF